MKQRLLVELAWALTAPRPRCLHCGRELRHDEAVLCNYCVLEGLLADGELARCWKCGKLLKKWARFMGAVVEDRLVCEDCAHNLREWWIA